MTVKGSIPARVLGNLKRALKDNPDQLTVRDLAQLLDVPTARMYRYMKLLREVGLVESDAEPRRPTWGGHPSRLWRWTG